MDGRNKCGHDGWGGGNAICPSAALRAAPVEMTTEGDRPVAAGGRFG